MVESIVYSHLDPLLMGYIGICKWYIYIYTCESTIDPTYITIFHGVQICFGKKLIGQVPPQSHVTAWCAASSGTADRRGSTPINQPLLGNNNYNHYPHPIGSMYGIYANIGGILMVNVTIYSIHGSYGYWSHVSGVCPIGIWYTKIFDYWRWSLDWLKEGFCHQSSEDDVESPGLGPDLYHLQPIQWR